MSDELTFEFSKEGFESRFSTIQATYQDSVFTKEEYDGFRESEMDEILFSEGSSNLLRWLMVLFLVLSILLLGYGLLNHNVGFIYSSVPTLIVTFSLWRELIPNDSSRKSISIGDRQEIIDHLLNKQLISEEEAKSLHDRLIKLLSEE